MLVPFLIMLREGIEAALIVGIVATYLRQTGRASLMPAVWVGVVLAAALSLFVGAGLQFASAEFPQKMQELFEALVGFVAVGVLTSMVFWMRKVSHSIKGELQASIDEALAHSSGQGQGLALVGIVFFAVAREGLESVFFLLAIFQQSESALGPLGALLGVLAAVAVGFAIYVGGVRLNLRWFFRWTGIFILAVAAGVLSGALRALHEAGFWNHLQTIAFNLSGVLPVDSPLGTVFAGVFGYQDAPAIGELAIYVAYLAITLVWFLTPPGKRSQGEPVARPHHS
ncbi:MAG: FTR1 family protein [Parvibaculaceae bacterium]|nr:FTR1 family protein [Parvibaculaceae bacterium]